MIETIPKENFNDVPRPIFKIGTIPIFGNLFLAPMDGMTDSPFRIITRQLGSAASFTEFINALDVLNRFNYAQKRLFFQQSERPLIFQVYDDDPDRLLLASKKLLTFKPDAIDINMGCCAPSVANRGAGAGLLKQPQKIARIFTLLTQQLPIPITGKIRLGWDENSRNYLEIARIIEGNGGSLISVHGRTHRQKYSGTADWDPIAEIKQTVSIPVIGNGDVRSTSDIQRILQHTGCDGVMIGRAALDNPWIFSGLDRESVPVELVRSTLQLHLELLSRAHGSLRGLVLLRKFASRYIHPYQPDPTLRRKLLTATEADLFFKVLDEILPAANPR